MKLVKTEKGLVRIDDDDGTPLTSETSLERVQELIEQDQRQRRNADLYESLRKSKAARRESRPTRFVGDWWDCWCDLIATPSPNTFSIVGSILVGVILSPMFYDLPGFLTGEREHSVLQNSSHRIVAGIAFVGLIICFYQAGAGGSKLKHGANSLGWWNSDD